MLNEQSLCEEFKDESELALEQEIAVLRSCININPNNAKAHNNLAWAFYQKGQLELAIAELEEVLRINPDNLDVRFAIAWVLEELGQLEEAIAKCKEVIDINPKHPGIHVVLASALEKQNNFQEAIAEYEIGISIDPDCASNYLSLGVLLLELSYVDKGMFNLEKAKELYHNQGDDSMIETVDIIAASYDDISIKLINKYCSDRRLIE